MIARRAGLSVALGLALLLLALWRVDASPQRVWEGLGKLGWLLVLMWPPSPGGALPDLLRALAETLAMAFLGTLLAALVALPLSFLAAQNFTSNPVLRWIAQFIFVSSRSVNSLIWALLFVAIFGPGALAGVFSIAVRSIGFVGKLFGEALEEVPRGPIEALSATGAPRAAILLKGYWPQAEPAFWSVALLRWDINIRESAVLGLVGAGGIGVALDAALNNLYWDQVGLILATIFAVVVLTEIVTSTIRSRII